MWYNGFLLVNIRAERHERQLHDFEALFSERNTDNGNGENEPCHKITNGDFPTQKKTPNNVDDRMFSKVAMYAFAEWPYHKHSNFNALDTKRNANNGYAQKQPRYQVKQSAPKADQYKPKKITDEFHIAPLKSNDVYFFQYNT